MATRKEFDNFHSLTPVDHIGALQSHGGLLLRDGMTARHLWEMTGLMDLRPDGTPMHNAPEHMLKVTDTVQVLASAFAKEGLLEPEDVIKVMQAAALHDAHKGLESTLLRECLAASLRYEDFQALLSRLGFQISPESLEQIYNKYELMLEHGDQGLRGLAAYDLAGELSRAKLLEMGFDGELVTIAGSVGHSSCVEIPFIGDVRLRWMRMVMHYADDIVVNSSIQRGVQNGKNALDLRIDANEANSKYSLFNRAWPLYTKEMYPDYSNRFDTAYQMQRVVGHQVELELATAIGLSDNLLLPDFIEDDLGRRVAGIQVRNTG